MPPSEREPPGSSALSQLRQGLTYALSTAPIRRVMALFGVVGLLGFNWQVAVPLISSPASPCTAR